MLLKFDIKQETIQQKKDRLIGQYPHNTWCPNCLKRMIDSEKAELVVDQLYCSTECSKEARLNNISKLRRVKKTDATTTSKHKT